MPPGFSLVTLTYPALDGRPTILTSIECLLTGRTFLFPMLVDTGSDRTSFPASVAATFGHDNKHPRVKKAWCKGVGGRSRSYLHSVQVSLIHPTRASHQIVWRSSLPRADFVENLDCRFGLIGMDIIKQWKSVTMENSRHGLRIIIRI